jgi:outer membrane autotransporter protein
MKSPTSEKPAISHRLGSPSPRSAGINRSTTLLAWILLLFGLTAAGTAGAQATIQFTSSSFSVDENAGTVDITVSCTDTDTGPASAVISVSDETAAVGEDFQLPASNTVSCPSDEPYTITLIDDPNDEANETLTITLSAANGTMLGSPTTATVTILDDDEGGTLQFSSTGYSADENAGDVTITVTRTDGSDGPASVDFATSDGTASGEDYNPAGGTLHWANGDAADKTFTVTLIDDATFETNETVTLTLSNPTGAALGSPTTATLTIINDDPAPTAGTLQFSRTGYSAVENAGDVTITVTRTGGSDGAASVDFATSNGTAVAGEDYNPAGGTLHWANGDAANKTFTVTLIDDETFETAETVTLTLTNATGAAFGNPTTATLTITNDEPPPAAGTLQFSASGYSVAENAGPATITVTRAGGSEGPVSVQFATSNGTAIAGEDYDPASGTLTWANGDAADKAFTVTLIDDTAFETSKTVMLNLTNASGAVLGNPTAATLTVTTGGLAGVAGLDEVARPVAMSMDQACPAIRAIPSALRTPGQRQLLATCNELITGQAGSLNAALRELAPLEVSAQGKFATEIANTNLSNVGARIRALQSPTAGVSFSGLTLNYDGQSLPASALDSLFASHRGGAASADDALQFGNWGVFVNGSVSFGESDPTTREAGFSFDTGGITTGADYRFNNNFVLGGAFTYASQSSDFDASAGELDINGYHFNAYGLYDNRNVYYNDAVYLDAIASVGWNDYETSRQISVGSVSDTATADTSGNQYAFSLGVRYKVHQDGFAFGPTGRLTYVRADIDGYQENASAGSGSGLLLAIDDQTTDSLTTALGGEASYRFDTRYGVYSPHIRVDWTYQLLDDSRLITSRFVNDPTLTPFSIPTDSPDRNYFNLGIGAKAVFPRRITGFFYYQTPLGLDGLSQNSIAAGIRVEFD